MKTYRIAVLGLHHDHIWSNLEELGALEHGELVAAADPNGPLLEKVKGLYPGCETYEEYAPMLDAINPGAVYVFGSNRVSAELSAMALRRGIHVMVEKPMAADLAGAEDMLAAAGESRARLMINWPFAWWPQLQKAIAMAQDGAIGRLWQVKYRAAHEGPRELGCSEFFCDWLYDAHLNGAGALMDYCCYGSALACVLLGKPEKVSGVTGLLCKKDIEVEDNAIFTMTYPNAFATTEASWTQVGKLTAYNVTILGERGTMTVAPRGGGLLTMATAEDPEGSVVEVPGPEPHLRSASAHFLWGIESGEPFMELCSASIGRDGQAILEAGLASSRHEARATPVN